MYVMVPMIVSKSRPSSREPRLVQDFWRSEAGVAAIEFAFVIPVLLLIYVFLIDFSRALDEKRKVDRLSQSIADLVSQQNTSNPITSSTVASILGASTALTAPYQPAGLSSTVSVVNFTMTSSGTCCNANVSWSVSQGGTPRPCSVLSQVSDTVPPAPGNMLASVLGSYAAGASAPGEVIIADVNDGFQPIFNGLFTFFSGGFQRTSYLFLRGSGQLVLQTPVTSQQGQTAVVCS